MEEQKVKEKIIALYKELEQEKKWSLFARYMVISQ